jgi:hypothetical protein
MAEDLKEKFKRIYKKSNRINLKKVDIVYTSIKEKQRDTKEPSTISEIAADTKLKKTTVWTYVGHLKNADYIKKNRKYTPPFLKATTKKSEVEFIYGKDKRDSHVEDETKEALKTIRELSKEAQQNLAEQIKIIKTPTEYNSKFLSAYNKIVEQMWKEKIGNSLVKLEIGSGANRYLIY